MTVSELFEHFIRYFDKIIYSDKKNKIEDAVLIKINSVEYDTIEYDIFVKVYGRYKVIEWYYDCIFNNIVIEIKGD